MKRVVIVGPGGAGKPTLAARLAAITRLPVIELDQRFWQPGLVAPPRDQWIAIQQALVRHERWIMDGDLGPHDVPDVRLKAADTVIVLDFPLSRCAWRTLSRSHESVDYWRWLLSYRRRSRPLLMAAIATHAGAADRYVLRSPRAVTRFIEPVTDETRAGDRQPATSWR